VERYRLGSATESATPGGRQPRPAHGTGRMGRLPALAAAYETQLLRRNAVDYPAMLTLPLRAFECHPAALRLCRDAYRAILADEFQDLCGAQYALLRLLGHEHRNVIVVGDPRQALYAWRGASVRFFGQFLADFPEAQVHVLDQNFRATGHLVALANALGTALGYPRGLWTDNPAGQEALLYGAADECDEAAFVAAEIFRLSARGQVGHLGDIAVLYRTNAQARTLVEALQARGLAHELVGGGMDDDGHADALASDAADRAPISTAGDAVVLTTVHAAKGAEWRVVFVVGLEDGLLPHARALVDSPDGDEPAGPNSAAAPARTRALEEELRVAYVAVTRPRERLYLTYCRTRQRGESRQPRRPSRFFQALPTALVRDIGAIGSAGRVG
jgi:superfamily I DNA/RNA helicase